MTNHQIPMTNEITMIQRLNWELEVGTLFVIGAWFLGFRVLLLICYT